MDNPNVIIRAAELMRIARAYWYEWHMEDPPDTLVLDLWTTCLDLARKEKDEGNVISLDWE